MNRSPSLASVPAYSPSSEVQTQARPAVYRSAEVATEPAPAIAPAPAAASRSGKSPERAGVVRARGVLLGGCVVAAAVAWLVAPASGGTMDPELATLLRGMAVIKAVLAILALGLVWWRLGLGASRGVALTYAACVWLLFAGSVLIWQLAFIPAAAILFHAGELSALALAWREGRHNNTRPPGFFSTRTLDP